MDKKLVFTGADREYNWLYKRYYYSGANGRYHSFQTALSILNQRFENPVILETGCQRLKEDLGGGMSTSIFAEYVKRYGGKLISVDISQRNLDLATSVVEAEWSTIDFTPVRSDSVEYLKTYNGPCNLLYLDSFDYPFEVMLNKYGGQQDLEKTLNLLWGKDPDALIKEFESAILPCQEHCVNEFLAIENNLADNTVLLLDDNLLPGGGKPRLLKEMLPNKGWVCLTDYQQSLWVKKI